MPTLVGFTADKLILNSSNFRREIVGLERINDIYTARTEDAADFEQIIINGASHKTVTGYLNVVPASTARFENMLVENVSTSREYGDITRFNVTYVGLCKDLSPRPIITIQPTDDYAFNPFVINIEFVEYIGMIASAEEVAFIGKYKRTQPLPIKINGYNIPRSSIPPFSGNMDSVIKTFDLSSSPFFSEALSVYGALLLELQKNSRFAAPAVSADGIIAPATISDAPFVSYGGFVIDGISYTRYGKFAHAVLSGSEQASLSFGDGDNKTSRRL